MRLSPPPRPDNAFRSAGPGRVESYFLRANAPQRPLALWVKATTLFPLQGPPVAETWFIFFDGERQRCIAQRHTEPFAATSFAAQAVTTSHLTLTLGGSGAARGRVQAPEGEVDFDLGWTGLASPIARPLSILPPWLLRGPFPKSKLLTPFPALAFRGSVTLPGAERIDVEGWTGMQGHNWGHEHAFEYAWGHCLFPESDALVEGFTGRVLVAGRQTPRLSALVVRQGARTWTFDRLLDGWRQRAALDGTDWSVALNGDDGEVWLRMSAAARPMVCLGYTNPDGALAYCLNTKLAEVELTVRPSDGASFTCRSPHGGALEFLQRTPDPRFTRVV